LCFIVAQVKNDDKQGEYSSDGRPLRKLVTCRTSSGYKLWRGKRECSTSQWRRWQVCHTLRLLKAVVLFMRVTINFIVKRKREDQQCTKNAA